MDMRLSEKLVFLIGSNGAGKSSTLQALAFLQFFANGNPVDFFAERGWELGDIRSRTIEKPHHTLRYHLLFEAEDSSRILWQIAWGLNSVALITETMWLQRSGKAPRKLFSYHRRGAGLISEKGHEVKGLNIPGSVLTVMDATELSPDHSVMTDAIDWCRRITSLELLSPVSMRSNVRGTPKGIGTRGQRLSGFLASLDRDTKARIVSRLQDFYPLEGLSTTRKKAGWVDLKISEAFKIGSIPTQHVSDGFLRLLALCAIPEFGSRSSLVLLDEIEDGIEPHILPRIIERIINDSSAQFVLTSHSPLLINFFDPATVVLVSRTEDGRSRFTPLTDLEVIKEGLNYFGPGEVWANSGLKTLNTQAALSNAPESDLFEIPEKFSDAWAIRYMASL